MSTNELSTLLHRRWAPAVLAELSATGGTRFVVLVNRLGAGRDTLSQTLAYLISLGLVRRNPGYGHPARPEYLLTDRGAELAPACGRLLELVEERSLADVALRKWSLPVLVELDRPRRFSELRAALPGASPRALALALKDLQRTGLVERTVTDDYPPAVRYDASPRARALAEAARGLA